MKRAIKAAVVGMTAVAGIATFTPTATAAGTCNTSNHICLYNKSGHIQSVPDSAQFRDLEGPLINNVTYVAGYNNGGHNWCLIDWVNGRRENIFKMYAGYSYDIPPHIANRPDAVGWC